jgi:cobalt-zinc-cadmium efflux system outer membrane protein
MKKHSYVRAWGCFIFIAFPGLVTSGAAQNDTPLSKCEQQFSLDTLRAFALKNSQLVAEIDSEYASRLAEAIETETIQNPELQVEHTLTRMNVGGANDSQSQISIGQPFRISNFGTRSEVAKLVRKSADLQSRLKLMELLQTLVQQFETLATYQQISILLLDAENIASKKVSLINEGVKKGLFSNGDQYLFEGEMFRLQAQAKSASSTISLLSNDLSKSIGLPCKIKAFYRKGIDELPSATTLIQRARESEIGESARVDLLLSLTKAKASMAGLDAFPQITPRFVYQHTNDGGDFFGAGISVPLPFWNRNQGQRYNANAEHRLAEVRSAYTSSGGLESQVTSLREAAVFAQAQAQLFESKVIPSFERAFHAQEKLYSQGKGNVLQVWQTLRAFNELQTQGLLLSLEARSLRIQLSTLVGEEI